MTRSPVGDNEAFSATYWSSIYNAHNQEGVVSGGTPSKGTGDFDVDIASGEAMVQGALVTIGSTTVTLSSADPTNPRVDLITIDSGGTVSATEGTAAADPVAPDIPANEVLLATILVEGGASSLNSAGSVIADYRTIVEKAPSYETVTVLNQGGGSDPTLSSNDAAQVLALTGGLDVSSRLNLSSSSAIQDAGTDAITFDGSQNVTLPGNLDVDGGAVTFGGATTVDSDAGAVTYQAAGNTDQLVLATDGNVGIGTSDILNLSSGVDLSASRSGLHVQDTGSTAAVTIDGQSPELIWFDSSGTADRRTWLARVSSGDILSFDTFDDSGSTLVSSILVMEAETGNVGIGTDDPSHRLTVEETSATNVTLNLDNTGTGDTRIRWSSDGGQTYDAGYSRSASRWFLETTDSDGGGTDADIIRVSDGQVSVDFNGTANDNAFDYTCTSSTCTFSAGVWNEDTPCPRCGSSVEWHDDLAFATDVVTGGRSLFGSDRQKDRMENLGLITVDDEDGTPFFRAQKMWAFNLSALSQAHRRIQALEQALADHGINVPEVA